MTLESSLITILDKREPHTSSNPLPHAYFSDAGKCSRNISYRILHRNDPKPESSHPRSLNSVLATKLGSFIHDQVQAALQLNNPLVLVEEVANVGPSSGRVDGYYINENNEKTVVEIKSMSDYMFTKQDKADFPDSDHLLQAMLGARALNATLVHIIYVNKSPRANATCLREWILPINNDLVDLELERFSNIIEDASQNIIADPVFHGEIILNPDKHYWPCGFCEFRPECKLLGPNNAKTNW